MTARAWGWRRSRNGGGGIITNVYLCDATGRHISSEEWLANQMLHGQAFFERTFTTRCADAYRRRLERDRRRIARRAARASFLGDQG